MTIRFTCDNCESVLKIRDEMAGTKAKCPKCKTPFVVPAPKPGKPANGNVVAKIKSPKETQATQETLEDLVDMPLELTPPVQFDTADGFDPLDVLSGGPPASSTPSASVDDKPKPSIAELMREHEANLAGKKSRRNKKSGQADTGAAAAMTAGTASDALARNYDQKRGKVSEPPPLTREERRAEEDKAAMKQFAIKGGAALAGIFVCAFFLISWMFSEAVPDLSYVSGVITVNGQPLGDAQITFSRQKSPDGDDLGEEGATPSTGTTDSSGKYTLMWDRQRGIEGVLPGTHLLQIVTSSGISYIVPPDQATQVVQPNETHTIDIKI